MPHSCFPSPGRRQGAARLAGSDCIVTAEGEERVEVRFSHERGLLRAPVRVRVTDPMGVGARRMFLGKALVLDAPIAPFDLKHNYQSKRYWCWTMANGVSEMVGSDSIPRGFRFDPANGTYDLYTYCDSSITYTFAWTTRGRKVPLRFPDVTQEGDTLRFRSVEMATAVGYEFELTGPN